MQRTQSQVSGHSLELGISNCNLSQHWTSNHGWIAAPLLRSKNERRYSNVTGGSRRESNLRSSDFSLMPTNSAILLDEGEEMSASLLLASGVAMMPFSLEPDMVSVGESDLEL